MAAAGSGLLTAPAASGPGSRGYEIAHGLAVQRRAGRVMRLQVRRETGPEEVLDGRSALRDRERVEQGQELEVVSPLEIEV
jgi:hypothetical protein